MNKLITATLFLMVCSFFTNPISTAVAAKHGHSKHHSHHASKHRHHAHHTRRGGNEGIASWYGHQFQGHRTANGERYDMYSMTAAHNSLPLSSYVEVTNIRNNRTVVVRINDRGPYSGNRVMDLSYAAAKELGIHKSGTAAIKITPLAMN
ncbi:MAG: septal ring lytic transglycosylase RlpA family protein [Methylovulum miyakonense]|uniref:septal ring lytic transglycosylase RlpA family protein n=1 Tax=Methylovulum miyakonense TaxID=645578 RepID=UPI003BB5181A